jgi:hypothetical protein
MKLWVRWSRERGSFGVGGDERVSRLCEDFFPEMASATTLDGV